MWDAEVSQVQLHIGLYAKSSYRGFLVAPYDSVPPIVRPLGALLSSPALGMCQLHFGSRGGYPLAALGSEDWCDAIHAGVFSDGRPSVHGVAPSPTAPASSRGRRV